ncbi:MULTISPECIES: ClbS/DfsB family four-helix bundle protein [unclassified Enterococcus]|uniref:ClbS/DfsB family four-helix bundle protein n=1 Tax=unclassified Enterococcus TaxID=2608891 RepID=UPI001553C1B1|nr:MULTISPECIES: ClbS/DfsB family four-helix bundle protein [unclassified Enterococcus]MBS7575957.1 ClbS/DfsB family four-helix bundle protein [Enterococcus sp. MMGLQ5-2]MBS7583190.1 ClbS/DfsB family four-helix bundle protein [Enterococcus sp. MMGLQ5-1]NPD11050.1 ClbS/DfsB family four-helix bundle protein [Enterococcus sp. MMGLQ5-1]NPD35793.1 ClbS/DfsB family four-helix bundle protein [Enterococcus sp. MMGLQ5-2]
MARPTTKTDLIQTGNEKYQKLMTLIHSIPEESINGVFQFEIEKEKGAHWERDKNIRDILIHLYEWHSLLLHWVEANQKGIKKQFLQDGYNWKTYGKMNIVFWEKHQNTSYESSLELLKKSHTEVIKLADTFSNDELFSKDVYEWVGGSTLGSYFVSVTSSHYDWAMKKIRKYKKSL